MGSIYPSASRLVEHKELVKYGEDMTKKATRIPVSKGNQPAIPDSNSVSNTLRQILGDSQDTTIEVYKISATKQRYSVFVDRNSGFIQKKCKEFQDVFQFDPKTFPSKGSELSSKISFDKVAYKNNYNQYITPLADQESNTINVYRVSASKQRYSVSVDRDSGFMTETSEEFQDISQFDPKTFPSKETNTPQEVAFTKVAYWNKYNQYITPKD